IHNPLKVTIKNFNCSECLQTIGDFFYEDVVSIVQEHERGWVSSLPIKHCRHQCSGLVFTILFTNYLMFNTKVFKLNGEHMFYHNHTTRAGLLLGPLVVVILVGSYFIIRGMVMLSALKQFANAVACHAYEFRYSQVWSESLNEYIMLYTTVNIINYFLADFLETSIKCHVCNSHKDAPCALEIPPDNLLKDCQEDYPTRVAIAKHFKQYCLIAQYCLPPPQAMKSKGGIANSKGGIANSKGGIANSKGGIANSKGGIANSKENI
uniref:Uncharacterized protein n=1 Tax=Glossina pallidipes TaxID=7398 RepID=A0A1B0AGT4_GLOPL